MVSIAKSRGTASWFQQVAGTFNFYIFLKPEIQPSAEKWKIHSLNIYCSHPKSTRALLEVFVISLI